MWHSSFVAAFVAVRPKGGAGVQFKFREDQPDKGEGDAVENLPTALRPGRAILKQLYHILRLQSDGEAVATAQTQM